MSREKQEHLNPSQLFIFQLVKIFCLGLYQCRDYFCFTDIDAVYIVEKIALWQDNAKWNETS